MRLLDAFNIKYQPIASIDLMERASVKFVEQLRSHECFNMKRIVLMAGPGNNGGDALAIARLLVKEVPASTQVEIFLFNTTQGLSADCSANKQRLLDILPNWPNLYFREVTTQFAPPVMDASTLVVDGLYGTGLSRPLEGGFAAVARYINASEATVVSIDIPSGLMAEDNALNNYDCIVHADYTFTFHAPKLAFLFPENEQVVGEWRVLDIGLRMPAELYVAELHASIRDVFEKANADLVSPYHLTQFSDIRRYHRHRSRFAHKGSAGHALLIAGQKNMAGAAVLSAKAALRSGVGKLTVRTQESNRLVLQISVPEALTDVEPDVDCFSQHVNPASYNAVGVGPGIGTSTATSQALTQLLAQCRVPMVLDADALNILARNSAFFQHLPKHSVLTPHRGELERLVGHHTQTFQLLNEAKLLSKRTQSYIALKGCYTAVVTPEGHIYFNTTGNPGMATAGSGDVLTGVIMSLLAQGYDAFHAALLGVWVHGSAGDLALASSSYEGLIASDIISHLPAAFAAF